MHTNNMTQSKWLDYTCLRIYNIDS